MRKLLLLLFSVLLFSLSARAQSDKSQMPVNKVDTISLPFKNPFRKFKKKAEIGVELQTQDYYLKKSGKYLKESARMQGLSLAFAAAGGIVAGVMAKEDKPIWAVPIALGGFAVVFEVCSIHLKNKSGQMLIMSAGVNGATVSLNF